MFFLRQAVGSTQTPVSHGTEAVKLTSELAHYQSDSYTREREIWGGCGAFQLRDSLPLPGIPRRAVHTASQRCGDGTARALSWACAAGAHNTAASRPAHPNAGIRFKRLSPKYGMATS